MSAPDWIERRERTLYWLVDATLAEPFAALGWPQWSAVERALHGGAAGSGRAATAILALPARAGRVHLRPVRHGGLLAPLWRGAIWGVARPVAELRGRAQLLAAGAPVPTTADQNGPCARRATTSTGRGTGAPAASSCAVARSSATGRATPQIAPRQSGASRPP